MLNSRPLIGVLPLLAVLAIAPESPGNAVQRSSIVALVSESAAAPFPAPRSVPEGTRVAIDGSPSLTLLSHNLKQEFELRYPGATVALAADGTPMALDRLQQGAVDLVALGRPLGSEEKDEGLAEVPLRREKIAILVGPNNPFKDQIGFEQFARIVSGEITNWKQLGGPDRPIRFVDRPEDSDTRQAFRYYDIFGGRITAGPTADPVNEDSTEAVIEALGDDGIGYALYSQVKDNPNVRIVRMGASPADPTYPFSQAQGYVYRDGAASEGAEAFLGWAASEPGQEVVKATRAMTWAEEEPETSLEEGPIASSTPATSPGNGAIASNPTATSPASPGATGVVTPTSPDGGFVGRRPWWLLLIPFPFLLAGLFFLWRTTRDQSNRGTARPIPPTPPKPEALPEATPTPVTFAEREAIAPHPLPPEAPPSSATNGTAPQERWRPHPPSPAETSGAGSEPPVSTSPSDAHGSSDNARVFPLAGAAALAGAAGMAMASRTQTPPSTPDTPLPDPWDTPETASEESERGIHGEASPSPDAEADTPIPFVEAEEAIAPPPTTDSFIEAEAIAPSPTTETPPSEAALAALADSASEGMEATKEAPEVAHEPALEPPEQFDTPIPENLDAHDSETLNGSAAPFIGAAALAGAAILAENDTAPTEPSPTEPSPPEPSKEVAEEVPDETAPETLDVPTEPVAEPVGGETTSHPEDTAMSEPEPLEANEASLGATAALAGAAILAEHVASPSDTMPTDGVASTNVVEDEELPTPEAGTEIVESEPATEYVKVDNRAHCFVMDPARLQQMQEVAVRYALENGHYKIFIESGRFDYQAPSGHPGEPWVLLWIYGGRFINQKTRVPVTATWSTLNGYHDSLTLEVLEPTTLAALFIDTYKGDNEGELTLAIERLAPPSS